MTQVQTYVLEYADVPPSMNTNTSRNWRTYQREKKRWEGIFGMLLLKERVPRHAASVTVTASLRFRTRHKRDEGNFRNMLEKALGDALQVVGVLADDTPEHFSFGALRFEEKAGPSRSTLTLSVTLP